MILRLVAAGAVAAAASCSASGAAVIEMPGRSFEPATITISAGDAVTWASESSQAHTVTARARSLPAGAAYFASGAASGEDAARADLAAGLIAPGGEFEHTFEIPGTYRYFCIPHEDQGMEGTVVVED